MKYKQVAVNIIILLGILASLIPIQGYSNAENLISQWRIEKWNDDIVVAWDWPSTFFEATSGSYINYTSTHYDSANFTHPSAGIIEIGNLTTQTTNNKTAEALVLSIYGWFPGLVTSSSNWSLQERVAKEVAQGPWTLGSLQVHELLYTYSGMLRQAINFSYNQDPSIGNQNTTLIYDKGTGVLLEGYTELKFLEYYVLKLKLTFSELISIESTAESRIDNLTAWDPILLFFTIISLGFFWTIIRARNCHK